MSAPQAKPSPFLKLPTREAPPPLAVPVAPTLREPLASGPGRWAAVLLFLLMLAAGGGLLFLAFVWPFLG